MKDLKPVYLLRKYRGESALKRWGWAVTRAALNPPGLQWLVHWGIGTMLYAIQREDLLLVVTIDRETIYCDRSIRIQKIYFNPIRWRWYVRFTEPVTVGGKKVWSAPITEVYAHRGR